MSTPRRHWFFRRPPESFWGDVIGGLCVLAGAVLGMLLYGDFSPLVGALVGLMIGVAWRSGRRRIRQRAADRPPTLGPDS